jgi:hypothetical protein
MSGAQGHVLNGFGGSDLGEKGISFGRAKRSPTIYATTKGIIATHCGPYRHTFLRRSDDG